MCTLKLYIPTRWEDVKVDQFARYRKELSSGSLNETKIKVMTCSIFCNENIDTIQKLKLAELNRVYLKITELLDTSMRADIDKIIVLNGKKYGFHPNLSEMTTGEWADIEEEIREANDVWEVMPEILAILYRPITKIRKKRWYRRSPSYEIEDYKAEHIENADDMRTMDMRTANAVSVFFYHLGRESVRNSTRSMKSQLKKAKRAKTTSPLSLVK